MAPTPAPADTLSKYKNPAGVPAPAKRPFLRSKGFRAVIVPALLIGYGISTMEGHGLYSSYDVRNDVHHVFGDGHYTRADDFLQYAPYLELGAVLLAGVESCDDRVNLGLLVLKSGTIMVSTVWLTKMLTDTERPDGFSRRSFPSGHTAHAFLAASIVHHELRHRSPWYGIGAYAIATSVGALRVINNRHWQSDVVAGAGFGILSVQLAYLTHRNRWGRKPLARDLTLLPSWSPAGGPGLALSWRPQ